jgi:polyhydroxyalkanoate synthesis regulator phasin
MDKIKNLKLKKIYKEFEYLQSDYEYRQELISEIDIDFIKSVNDFLNKFPELKDLYEKKTQQKLDDILEQIKKKQQQEIEISEAEPENQETDIVDREDVDELPDIEEIVDVDDSTSLKIRQLYRSIVKLTHPDRIKDPILNELYVQSTKYYDEKDLHNLYRICDQLNIKYEMDEGDISELESKINKLRQKVDFTEGTYTWKWYHSPSEEVKSALILEYIKRQIG